MTYLHTWQSNYCCIGSENDCTIAHYIPTAPSGLNHTGIIKRAQEIHVTITTGCAFVVLDCTNCSAATMGWGFHHVENYGLHHRVRVTQYINDVIVLEMYDQSWSQDNYSKKTVVTWDPFTQHGQFHFTVQDKVVIPTYSDTPLKKTPRPQSYEDTDILIMKEEQFSQYKCI